MNFSAKLQPHHAKLAGNTVQFFKEVSQLISVNDGKRSVGGEVVNPSVVSIPFTLDQVAQIRLTTPSFTVTNMRKGFITARLKYPITINGLDPTMTDPDRLGKVFIGLRSSRQAFEDITLLHRGVPTTYQNKYIAYEGFCDAALSPWANRDKKRYVETLAENARQFLPDVCGVYRDLVDFRDGLAHDVEFECNIPLTNLLGFQAFSKWLGREEDFGQLEIQAYFAYTKPTLVIQTCSPRDVMENKIFLQTDAINYGTLAGDVNSFKHSFTQCHGDEFMSFTNIQTSGTAPAGTTTFTVGMIRATVGMGSCVECKSTIRGYDITKAARDAVMAKIENEELVIPAQQIPNPTSFPIGPTEGGLNTNINVPYINVCCAGVVFPKTPNQITVFENPMLKEVQLTIGSKQIPTVKYSTVGARYLQEQLIIADLDGAQQATAEFTDSIVNVKNKPDGARTRYVNSLRDDTSFVALFQTERGDGGYVYDGIDSGGVNLNTVIEGTPIVGGENDTYYYPRMTYNPANKSYSVDLTRHSPPPMLLLCQDTFFVLKRGDNGKLQLYYHKDRVPRGSQAE